MRRRIARGDGTGEHRIRERLELGRDGHRFAGRLDLDSGKTRETREHVGVGRDRLRLYTELNFCIKGTITAADNLFDDQSKSLLPLTTGKGDRFASILQLMTFERLTGLEQGIRHLVALRKTRHGLAERRQGAPLIAALGVRAARA